MSKVSKAWPTSSVKIHWTHLMAIIFLIGYFLISKAVTLHAFTYVNLIISFMQIYLFGTLFGVFLLYLLSHDKFFPLAKAIEKEENTTEKSLLKKYLHHGKILAVIIIGSFAGPVFSALTARILLNKFFYKYLLIILSNIPATFITLGLGKGFINIFNIFNNQFDIESLCGQLGLF